MILNLRARRFAGLNISPAVRCALLVFVGSFSGATVAVRLWHKFPGILLGSILAAGLSGVLCALQEHHVKKEMSGLQAYQAHAFHHQIIVMNALTKIYLATDLIGHPSHGSCEICASYKQSVFAEVKKIRKSVLQSVEILRGNDVEFDIPRELKEEARANRSREIQKVHLDA